MVYITCSYVIIKSIDGCCYCVLVYDDKNKFIFDKKMMSMSTLKYSVYLLSKHTLTKITFLHYNNTMYDIEREQCFLMSDNIDSCYNDTR